MKEKRNSFSKRERLSGKMAVDRLFASGKSFFVYPFLVQYEELKEPRSVPFQILISVSKRKFKHAVDRNSIKRQIRESYRLMKHNELEVLQYKLLNVGLIYVGSDKMETPKIKKRLLLALNQLINTVDGKVD